MLVDVLNKSGANSGQIDLAESVFGVEPNEHAMHLVVVAYLAHQRQGTAKTKVRDEVSGGGKKPWRQKGRGTARSGSSRSPVWVHGGTIHGPKPHLYNPKITKKLNRLAKRSALSLRFAENNITVVEDFALSEIKTKSMSEILNNLKLIGEKTLILLPEYNKDLYLSTRNIPNVSIQPADQISVYDILNHKKILLIKGAVEPLQSTCLN